MNDRNNNTPLPPNAPWWAQLAYRFGPYALITCALVLLLYLQMMSQDANHKTVLEAHNVAIQAFRDQGIATQNLMDAQRQHYEDIVEKHAVRLSKMLDIIKDHQRDIEVQLKVMQKLMEEIKAIKAATEKETWHFKPSGM